MDVFAKRRAGILLHPTSLPGSPGCGDLGQDALRFVDFLADCGIELWQTLPLGPTHDDSSPYQCLSVHAGNTRLISLQSLVDCGWLDSAALNESQDLDAQRKVRFSAAWNGFRNHANDHDRHAFNEFCQQHSAWLDDFSLYQALRIRFNGQAWYQWPALIRDRDLQALATEQQALAGSIEQIRFEQFLFFRQWQHLRRHANDRGVLLFGDIPIFVAYDSADVWANREWFHLGDRGELEIVAGVPPDYFSETGQRWGNPHYHWDRLEEDGFSWWLERVRSQMEMFDLVRIDHFRGFEAYWAIDADQETAVNGRWEKGPGAAFFTALQQEFGDLPLVAEDLGVITPEVDALRKQFSLPGMKILQFAFGGSADNPYLPHNHETLSVVYTGTHDNNTSLGWYHELDEGQREHLHRYLAGSSDAMPGMLVRAALASVARLAVIPMQDILCLDGAHRMNVPGVAEGNWCWRFSWDQLDEKHQQQLRDWVSLYGRSNS